MTIEWESFVGRTYLPGERDCLALVIDFYRTNFEIAIKNYARPTDWDADKLDLVRRLHEPEGFDIITSWRAKELRPGDILCMSIGASNANHLAVFIGDNQFIHHLSNRLSTVEPYRDFWRNVTGYLLRHPLVPDLRPVHSDVDLETLLRDRYSFAINPAI